MEILNRIFLMIMIMTLGGCSGIRVSQDFDSGVNFSSLNSYVWKTDTQPGTGDIQVDNPLIDNRIRKAIDATLANMGYRRVSYGPHDFKVSYTYDVRAMYDSSSVSVGTGFGIGGGGSFGGVGIGIPVGGDIQDEVLLVIDFTDPEKGNLLWRGTGTRLINMRSTPEERTEAINTLVEKVLAQFPVNRKI